MFDITFAVILSIVLSPLMIIIAVFIKADSKGPVMFRQIRVTRYGKKFRIFKFRTMSVGPEATGTLVTTANDKRVTKTGRFLRKYRLDELPQILNVISGDMTFVGTRPEVVKYVEKYKEEMMATLLIPAGITSESSIRYKDEEKLLSIADAADETYIEAILPEKMKCNLEALEVYGFLNDIRTMLNTVVSMVNRDENRV